MNYDAVPSQFPNLVVRCCCLTEGFREHRLWKRCNQKNLPPYLRKQRQLVCLCSLSQSTFAPRCSHLCHPIILCPYGSRPLSGLGHSSFGLPQPPHLPSCIPIFRNGVSNVENPMHRSSTNSTFGSQTPNDSMMPMRNRTWL